MEKTIYIDDKPVRLKSNASIMRIYKSQFRKDFFSELLKLSKTMGNMSSDEDGNIDLSMMSYEELGYLDFEPLYNFIWVLAKAADRNIPDPDTWLEGFETMPIAEVFPQILDLLENSIQSKKSR